MFKRIKNQSAALIAAVSLGTAGLGYGTAYLTYKDQVKKIEYEEAQRATKSEREVKELERQIDQQVAGLYAFKSAYNRHIQNLHVFSFEYAATPTKENEDRLTVEAQAFVEFVKGWREVNDTLKPLLDGEVDKISQALSSRDYATIHTAQQVLYSNCNERFPILEQKIRNLRWSK
jgi:hypothetical protein